jgi:hypothetical protein
VQLISFYISVPFFVSVYLIVYHIVVILILAGTLFRNKIKSESYNLLYVFNTLAAWCSLFVFLTYGAEYFAAWYDQNSYEWYAFKSNVPDGYWTMISAVYLLSFILGLLLFFRKLRIKRWFTLLFYLSSFSFLFEKIVIFITGFYRDYLPSSWSPYTGNMYPRYVYNFGLIILLLVVIYVWAKKKGRLPFPSVFLK